MKRTFVSLYEYTTVNGTFTCIHNALKLKKKKTTNKQEKDGGVEEKGQGREERGGPGTEGELTIVHARMVTSK